MGLNSVHEQNARVPRKTAAFARYHLKTSAQLCADLAFGNEVNELPEMSEELLNGLILHP